MAPCRVQLIKEKTYMPNYPEVNLYIAGEWRKTVDTMPVTNPADDAVIGRVACADRTDLEDAVKAAVSGFEVWRAAGPAKRA